MSLEAKIETLTAAVVALTQTLQAQQQAVPAPAPVQAPPVPQFAQQAVPAAPAPQMPAPPSFAPPAPPAPAPQGAPFTDAKGLIEYATAAYGQLGAEKGYGMQKVMTDLGVQNINDLRPEQYGAFYAAVEALKAQ